MIIGYLYCHQFCFDLYNTFCYYLYSTPEIVDEKQIIFTPFIFLLLECCARLHTRTVGKGIRTKTGFIFSRPSRCFEHKHSSFVSRSFWPGNSRHLASCHTTFPRRLFRVIIATNGPNIQSQFKLTPLLPDPEMLSNRNEIFTSLTLFLIRKYTKVSCPSLTRLMVQLLLYLLS